MRRGAGIKTARHVVGGLTVLAAFAATAAVPAYATEQHAYAAADSYATPAVTMSKGGKILVPADKIAYVEFGGQEARRVGFGNIA